MSLNRPWTHGSLPGVLEGDAFVLHSRSEFFCCSFKSGIWDIADAAMDGASKTLSTGRRSDLLCSGALSWMQVPR